MAAVEADRPLLDPAPRTGQLTPRRRWLLGTRIALGVACLLTLALAGGVLQQLIVRHSERHVIVWAIAAAFAAAATLLSLHEVHLHVLHWHSPLQRHYVRILFLVPVYAIESWLALRYKEQRIYLETLREAYEGLVIWSFMRLLLDFVGPGAEATLAARPHTHAKLMAPLCCVRGCRLAGGGFVRKTSLGVFQYVLVRVGMSLAALIAQWNGAYCEGEWAEANECLFPWATSLINLSQLVAMYCLVQFYAEFKAELAPLRPLGKFAAIKILVFLTFWQSVVVQGMVHAGVISDTLTYSSDDVAAGVQDFLICVEMFLVSCLHHFVFSVNDFWAEGGLAEKAPLFPNRVRGFAAARMAFNPGELATELRVHLGGLLTPGRSKAEAAAGSSARADVHDTAAAGEFPDKADALPGTTDAA